MCPQRSNRQALVDGALRCIEQMAPEQVTSRAIAEASGANVASITYHFGSKEALITEAAIMGLDRWLDEIAGTLKDVPGATPSARLQSATEAIDGSRQLYFGLARNLVTALARAQHDPRVRERLAEGFARSRPAVAAVLGLGDDEAGEDAAGLVLALFHGLLQQALLDPALAIEGQRMERALARLRASLPD